MKKSEKAAKEFDFEGAMKELEGIVKQLEDGNLQLEQALKLFERGVELARLCKVKLDEAELRVSKLVKDKEGLFREVGMDAEEEE